MAGEHVLQGGVDHRGGSVWWGVRMAEGMATEVGSTHPTVMHSCMSCDHCINQPEVSNLVKYHDTCLKIFPLKEQCCLQQLCEKIKLELIVAQKSRALPIQYLVG